MCWIFDAEPEDEITGIGFRYGTLLGYPPTYIVSLESLDG